MSDTAAVDHHDDARAFTELDTRRPANVQQWAPRSEWHASWYLSRRVHVCGRFRLRCCGGLRRPGRRCGLDAIALRHAVFYELHGVIERREILELQIGITGNAVSLAHRCKDFGLLHGIDTEVGFEVEVHLQHVFRIACHRGDD